jgi:hypothetical protein
MNSAASPAPVDPHASLKAQEVTLALQAHGQNEAVLPLRNVLPEPLRVVLDAAPSQVRVYIPDSEERY